MRAIAGGDSRTQPARPHRRGARPRSGRSGSRRQPAGLGKPPAARSRRRQRSSDRRWTTSSNVRANQSLAHVFTLLSLVLPREPLRIAFRGLHTDDPRLRGTALEYLEHVLPRAIRERLWPFLDAPRARAGALRPRDEVLADLLQSNPSIMMHLEELRRLQPGTPGEQMKVIAPRLPTPVTPAAGRSGSHLPTDIVADQVAAAQAVLPGQRRHVVRRAADGGVRVSGASSVRLSIAPAIVIEIAGVLTAARDLLVRVLRAPLRAEQDRRGAVADGAERLRHRAARDLGAEPVGAAGLGSCPGSRLSSCSRR